MSGGAAGGVVAEHLTGLAGLSQVEAEWRQLAWAAGSSTLFGPDWVRAHIETYGLGDRVHLFLARRGGRLAAVAPMLAGRSDVRGVPVRTLSGAVGHSTLRFDITAAAGAGGAAAVAAIWQAIRGWGRWDCLELWPVPAGGWCEQMLQRAEAEGFPVCRQLAFHSRYLDLSNGFDPVLAATRPHFRAELRRTRRRLEERGKLALQAVWEYRQQDLEDFLRMEAAGWKGHVAGGRAVLTRPPQQREFYLKLCAGAAASGQYVLHRLMLGERPLAVSIGLWGRDTYHAVRWSYDEEFAAYGPGHLMIESIARECARQGLREFDFTGVDCDYKLRWAQHRVPHGHLFVFRRGWRGRGLRWLKLAGRRGRYGERGTTAPVAEAAG